MNLSMQSDGISEATERKRKPNCRTLAILEHTAERYRLLFCFAHIYWS